jgi:predicted transposase/invertase (TIGR01784 family)
MTQKKISKTLDAFVRWLLSNPGHEEILRFLINAVRKDSGLSLITRVVVKNPFSLSARLDAREFILDVSATDEGQRQYDIEVQTSFHEAYRERALCYLAKAYSSQMKKGAEWVSLKGAFGIHICDFVLFATSPKPHSEFQLREIDGGFPFSDHLQLHFIELPKYAAAGHFETDLEKLAQWFIFEPEGEGGAGLPAGLAGHPVFEFMAEKLQAFTQDEILEAYAESRERFLTDQRSFEVLATRRGMAEGARAKALETARKLKARGLPLVEIADITDLSPAEIKTL